MVSLREVAYPLVLHLVARQGMYNLVVSGMLVLSCLCQLKEPYTIRTTSADTPPISSSQKSCITSDSIGMDFVPRHIGVLNIFAEPVVIQFCNSSTKTNLQLSQDMV